MTWLRTSLRRLRADRATALGLAMLIGITAFVGAVAPRVLTTVADDALRGEMALAPVSERGLAFAEDGLLSPELEAVGARGTELADDLPAVVRERLGQPALLIDSARWVAGSAVDTNGTIRFRFQPGALERVRFEAGRAPTGATSEVVRDRLGGGGPVTVVRFEGALSIASAEQLGVEIGDVIELAVDPADLLGRNGQGDVAAMILTGIFSVPDVADPFWWDDPALVGPTVREVNSNLAFVDATALLADEAYPPLVLRRDAIAPVRYTWRHPAIVERFDAAAASEVATALRRVESQYPPVSVTFGQPTSSSSLRLLLEDQTRRWSVAEAILAILAVGAAAVALAAIGLVAQMLATRRRSGLALSVGRGATRGQVLATALAEGAILAGPAALVALSLAMLVVPDSSMRSSALVVLGVALVAIGLSAGTTVGALRGRGGRGVGQDPGGDPTRGRRRLILEGSAVVVAVLGVVVLQSRGLTGGATVPGPSGEASGVDPLLASVPALVGLAAGVVAVRTFRVPLRALDSLAGVRRGLAGALAIRRLTRGHGAAPVLLVLLGTATIASFAMALFAHVDRAAQAIAWNEVGADYRVSGSIGRLPDGFQPLALPGVTAAAGAYRGSVPIGDKGARVDLVALDAVDYAMVVAGTPAAASSGAELAGIRPAVAPTIADPTVLPVVIASGLTVGVDALGIGDPVSFSVEGVRVRGQVVAIRDDLPTLPAGGRGALIPRDDWPLETPPPATTTVFLRAPADAAATLLPAIADAVPGARIVDQAALETSIRSAPVAEAVRAGVAAALLVAAGYAALAVAVALALTGAARAVEAAHLRLLGLGPRGAVLLVVLEYGPLIGIAFVLGSVLGIGLFLLIRPALGLDVIVGSDLAVPLAIAPLDALLTLGAIIVVAAVGIGLGALAERRAMTSGTIRLGLERS